MRIIRDGRPVGVLVLTAFSPDASTASGVLLPNADGAAPAVQVGDDVRP